MPTIMEVTQPTAVNSNPGVLEQAVKLASQGGQWVIQKGKDGLEIGGAWLQKAWTFISHYFSAGFEWVKESIAHLKANPSQAQTLGIGAVVLGIVAFIGYKFAFGKAEAATPEGAKKAPEGAKKA